MLSATFKNSLAASDSTSYKNIHRFRLTKKFQCIIVKNFLPIIFSICFGCSKEPFVRSILNYMLPPTRPTTLLRKCHSRYTSLATHSCMIQKPGGIYYRIVSTSVTLFSIFYMLYGKNRVFNPYFSIGSCPMRKRLLWISRGLKLLSFS